MPLRIWMPSCAAGPENTAAWPIRILSGVTPGAPWRIRITEELRQRFVEEAPQDYVDMFKAMRVLGVSRQTVLQRVKRGELSAVHVRCGKRNGLYIKVLDTQTTLFDSLS